MAVGIKYLSEFNEEKHKLIAAKLYMSAFHIFATAINLKPNHTESYMLLGGKSSAHL